MRNDHVVRVVAAEKEKADERFVIGRVERRGAEATQIEDRVENAGGRQRGAGGLADKRAAGRRSHIHLSTTNSGEFTTRKIAVRTRSRVLVAGIWFTALMRMV